MSNDNGITIGQLTEQLNKKVDLPDGISQDTMDYVVEWKSPTADDTTWFRKYKSGWVEQGGEAPTGESKAYVITLPKPFENAEYNVTVTCLSTGDTSNGWGYAHERTTTQFKIVKTASAAVWSACGQGAE